MPPNTTLWPLEPHTVGKHEVLRNYLKAWLPIMLSSNDRVLFIDAFAGPGRYLGGESGSPLIALDVLRSHTAQHMMTGHINYMFIEKDPRRAENLKQVLDPIRSKFPSNCQADVFQGTFTDTMTEVLDTIDAYNSQLAPALVMVDPFGVSDTPMKLIQRILENPKSEVYISFMYRDINRFKTTSEFISPLDDLFGCQEWRDGISIGDFERTREFFYGLYKRQLKEAGSKHVLHFDLYEGNSLIYALFFATKNDLGCDRMKQAMWKVAPFGAYSFRGETIGQFSFGAQAVNFEELDGALIEEFGMNNHVAFDSIEEFICSDRTLFHSGQLKGRLTQMEKAGTLIVDKSTRKRGRGYPPGTLLRFAEAPPESPVQGRFDL